MTDTIFITGVVIHARHGVMEHETEVGQRFVIDLELFTDLSEPSHTDRLADTVSYSNVVATATEAFRGTNSRFCIISFTSDWLFPTSESRELVHALNAVAANVSFVEIETDKGHDAFLLHEPELFATLSGFLNGCAEHRGVSRLSR